MRGCLVLRTSGVEVKNNIYRNKVTRTTFFSYQWIDPTLESLDEESLRRHRAVPGAFGMPGVDVVVVCFTQSARAAREGF